MSNYDKLSDLICDGQIDLITIEAIPRSISTALCRALGEAGSKSVCVNEPFSRTRYDIDDASTRILDAIDAVGIPEDKPLTVVTKNMARNISKPILSELVDLSKGIVWSIRDPQIQIGSLITRAANDLFFSPGADVLSMDDLTDEHIKAACGFLETGPKWTDFAKTNWSFIGEHHQIMSRAGNSTIVDGTALTTNPQKILSGTTKALGLTFSERMISGWQGKFVNTNTGYAADLAHDEDAWTRDATISTGIHASSTKTIDMDRMTQSLQDHITEVAMPTYERMLAA